MVWFILGLSIGIVITYIVYRNEVSKITMQVQKARTFNNQSLIKSSSSEPSLNTLIDELNALIRDYHEASVQNYRILRQTRQMTTSIAHDFRTPLTSMLGYVQLVNENISDKKDKLRLDLVEQRIKLLNTHVEAFYTLSQLSSNEYPINLTIQNPTRLLSEHLATYYDTLKRKFDTVTIDVLDHECYAHLDSHAFTRILENITRNALIHGEDSFTVTSSINENLYIVEFSNNGVSDSIDISRVFERNYKQSEKNTNQSSGLGLSIAYELAQAQNITLEARITGDVIYFRLTIPCTKDTY